jgi:hypothetical protein
MIRTESHGRTQGAGCADGRADFNDRSAGFPGSSRKIGKWRLLAKCNPVGIAFASHGANGPVQL